MHRRTFRELRQAILIALLSGQQTTNEISIKTGINWRSAEAHITFLVSKGFVSEILRLEYVRIFKLTPIGEEHARFLLQTSRDVSSLQPQRKQYGKKAKMEVMQHDLFGKKVNQKTTAAEKVEMKKMREGVIEA